MMEVKKHVYITVNGREVEYQAISLDALRLSWGGIEKQFRERGEPIDPPTYEFITASGAKVTEPHDATTAKTPEELNAWETYLVAANHLQYEKNFILMQYIFEDGLESVQVPKDDKWLAKHKRRLIEIPEDPTKLREFYITAEVLKTPDDIAGLTASVMLLSQEGKVDEAALETALESFRSFMGQQTAEGIINGKKQMEILAKVL